MDAILPAMAAHHLSRCKPCTFYQMRCRCGEHNCSDWSTGRLPSKRTTIMLSIQKKLVVDERGEPKEVIIL